jgi:hypothetical protein
MMGLFAPGGVNVWTWMSGGPNDYVTNLDTWSYPTPRAFPAMCYDSTEHVQKMWMFGGFADASLNGKG